ncbi:MAG: response regulator transcription factor [Chitinophagaceae bacterium]|nr:response regulator transcription factor [Chitinophagaceae bacterium]MCB9045001.1 response regulator transcription factor [Chitinophagales bacterium]
MFRAIIVDDETQARSVLREELLQNCPSIKVIAETDTVGNAVKEIKRSNPDLIFLDIQLTDGLGFNILEQIGDSNAKVIFTTAYSQYALKAIKFSALDYLLKPIDGQELKQAVDKLVNMQDDEYQKSLKNYINNKGLEGRKKRIALHTSKGVTLCPLEDIIYCEAEGNYTRVVFANGKTPLLMSKTLKDFEDMLSHFGFERIHTSFLINIDHLRLYINRDGGSVQMSDGCEIPVARRKRAALLKLLEDFNK